MTATQAGSPTVADEQGTALVEALEDTRRTLARTDTQAGALLQISGALLGALSAAAVAIRPHLPTTVAVLAGAGTAALALSVATMLLAVRPRRGGGGPAYYAHRTPAQLRAEFAAVDINQWRSTELAALSGIVTRKHRAQARAVTLLGLALLLLTVAGLVAVA